MQINAKLHQLLPIQTAIGKNRDWKKLDILLETEGQYSKKICVSNWGAKSNEWPIANRLGIED
jgi:hypothetical protein